MAKTGDLHLATNGDFFMAMGIGSTPCPRMICARAATYPR